MRALSLLMMITMLGCGSSTAPVTPHRLVGEPSDEDDELPPLALGGETLPPLPVSVHESDEVVAEALRLSRDAVLPERPTLDDAATDEETARFMREDFQAWMVQRARAIGAARTALGQMEHGEPDEYVLASALIGTLFAMLAREVQELPLPRAIRDDASERVLVREALLEAAAPLYRRALDALGACASTASGAADPTLDPWARYCDDATERAEQAPHPVDTPGERVDAGVAP
jgi:DNA-binding XRE family transcriptional regulator